MSVQPVDVMNGKQRQATANPRPSQLSWAGSPPACCYSLHPPSPFIIITQYMPNAVYLIAFTINATVNGGIRS